MTDTKPPFPTPEPQAREQPAPDPGGRGRGPIGSGPIGSGPIGGRPIDSGPHRSPIGGQPAKPPPRPAGPGPRTVSAAAHSMADMLIGTVVAKRYKLLHRIGEGAMGWVFLGEHVEIGKKVAVKVLRPSLCRLPEAVSRFRREARSATQVGSKHIVDVTDFGTTDTGAVFFVMEYLDGEDLSSTLKREKFLPWQRVVHVLEQMCEALQAAHDTGIIHRDVKPANFYRVQVGDDPDFIKILDFGIARLANPQDSIVTQTGVVMGTPDFMAPEQAMGKHVDHRADIYSLGASAYALLTGRPPFEGANEYDVIYKQLNDDPSPPSAVAPIAAGMPKWLDTVILKALRKDPEDRYESMRALGQALREGQQAAERGASLEPVRGGPGTAEPPSKATAAGTISPLVWVAVLAILAVLGGVGYTLLAN